jgi:O-acetyl-ADP-ribose deacetylase (regulator of RNase III)
MFGDMSAGGMSGGGDRAESESQNNQATYFPARFPELVLCAVNEPLAHAWSAVLDKMNSITGTNANSSVKTHQGSIMETSVDAVVSPANSFGWMRGGVDAVYLEAFPHIEERVRGSVLTYHGGELPVGEAVIVPTGAPKPTWLISAPTMREPTEKLPPDTVHPFLAARAVFTLWSHGLLERTATSPGEPGQGFVAVRETVTTIAMPGLGTGIGGVSPETCAHQVAAAWEEVFGS